MVNTCRRGTFLEILSAVLNYFNYCLLPVTEFAAHEWEQEAERATRRQSTDTRSRPVNRSWSAIASSTVDILSYHNMYHPSFTWSNASTRSPSARLISPQYNLPCLAMVITARAGSQNCPAGCRKYPPSVAIPRQSGLLNFDIDTTSICIILRKCSSDRSTLNTGSTAILRIFTKTKTVCWCTMVNVFPNIMYSYDMMTSK